MSTAAVDPPIANPATERIDVTEEESERPTTTSKECIEFFNDYIEEQRESLKLFYNDEAIAKLAEKAEIMFGSLIELGCLKETAQQLTLLLLYDIVMLIDDSRSMKTEQGGERIKTLHCMIDNITRVYDHANEKGIKSLKFLNDKKGIANVRNKNWKKNFKGRAYNGLTRIGTSLSEKILDKFVWGGTMTKPLLVMIITDGDVEGERKGLLADVMADCVKRLAADDSRANQAVSFHFSRVGNDRKAKALLETLDNNKEFGNHVDCLFAKDALENLQNADEEYRWRVLPKLLLGAISTYWDEEELTEVTVDTTDITGTGPGDDSDVDAGSDDDEDDEDADDADDS